MEVCKMTELRVSEGIVPMSEFKARAADWLARIAKTDQPVVITQNGRAAGVLLSPRAYDQLLERARFVAAIEAGLADADAGRTIAHVDMVAETKARYGKPPNR
jgi:prevent-host-death family protein